MDNNKHKLNNSQEKLSQLQKMESYLNQDLVDIEEKLQEAVDLKVKVKI